MVAEAASGAVAAVRLRDVGDSLVAARAMVMVTKRVMVMVTATRVGKGSGQLNRHWQWRQERLLWRQGWRARNSIQGDGEGNRDTMARPTPTTTFDVRGGGGQQPPLSRAP